MSTQLVSTGITFPDATTQTTAVIKETLYRWKILTSGTTYTKPSDVVALYVFVCGSSGGRGTASTSIGGRAGVGYSETYYASPAASYSYSIGAAGAAGTGNTGGTTTFGAMSVTGGGGTATSTGSTAGGVGSGGTFNATGGAGGNARTAVTAAGGGSGGAGSRAGNGGNGAAAPASAAGGGGGGTGGNNASGGTGGAAATSKAAGALTLPFPSSTVEIFDAGDSPPSAGGGDGATPGSSFTMQPQNKYALLATITGQVTSESGAGSSGAGTNGKITILEVLS